MEDEERSRFRRAYWQAFRELHAARLRQWEQSRVTLPQLRVLYHLRRQPAATTSAVSRALGITVSTASGLVSKLVDRGLVERTSIAGDRRQAPLQLTEPVTALLGELSGVGRVFLDRVADASAELPSIVEALERIARAAQAAWEALKMESKE